MLTLGRKKNQIVTISHEEKPDLKIVIQVRDIGKGQVKLGFDAPQEYLICREEIAPNKDR